MRSWCAKWPEICGLNVCFVNGCEPNAKPGFKLFIIFQHVCVFFGIQCISLRLVGQQPKSVCTVPSLRWTGCRNAIIDFLTVCFEQTACSFARKIYTDMMYYGFVLCNVKITKQACQLDVYKLCKSNFCQSGTIFFTSCNGFTTYVLQKETLCLLQSSARRVALALTDGVKKIGFAVVSPTGKNVLYFNNE